MSEEVEDVEATFLESERPTRPTQPPTVNDLIQALAGTNELIISLQSELRSMSKIFADVRKQTRDHGRRLSRLEAQAAE